MCGLDYRSAKLWDQYIAWEKDNGSPQQVMEAYDQVLPVPLLQHQQYYDRYGCVYMGKFIREFWKSVFAKLFLFSFKQFVMSKAVYELISSEKLAQLQCETEGEVGL